MFFVPLQIHMKKALTSFAAVLLVLWYLLSVIGFDVHTCASSGDTFIATVASGFSCDDIHPEHHSHKTCKSCCECHHHEQEPDESSASFGVKSCCTDDFQVIALTGTRAYESYDCLDVFSDTVVEYVGTDCQLQTAVSAVQSLLYKPGFWICILRDRQASYGIWRI